MSESLFPDATTVASVSTGDDRTGLTPGIPRRPQRLSIASAVMGSLALIGDVVIVILGLLTVTGSEPTSDARLLGSVLIVFGAIAAFWLGLLLAILGIAFGVLALTRRQRRGPAVIGLVLSGITLCLNLALGLQLLVDPAQLSLLASLGR